MNATSFPLNQATSQSKTPHLFNNLPLFQDAKKEIESLRPSLAILGDIICKNGLEQEIGINLLHRHFELSSHEALVKTIHDEYAVISPTKIDASLTPYIFRAQNDGFAPTEFISEGSHFYKDVKSKQALLKNCGELQDALISLGVSEKLGIFIRHQQFDEANGSAWVEDSTGDRELMITKKPVDKNFASTTTETNWYFVKQNQQTSSQVGVVCGICCVIHCGVHCGWHN